jgi:hypothetical protein
MEIISRKDGEKRKEMNSRIQNKLAKMRCPRLARTFWLIKHRRRHAYAMHYA